MGCSAVRCIISGTQERSNVIPTHLQIFEFFFPEAFTKEVVMPQTNKNMMEGGHVIIYGDFLLWIGMWFMTATIQVFQ